MVCIPGGPFWRGNDNGKPDEKPRTRIVISPYFMDTYEVDNDQYFKCVEAGKCDPPIKHYVMYTRPKQPVVAVSWFEAYAFCQAVGKRRRNPNGRRLHADPMARSIRGATRPLPATRLCTRSL
jgi:formylglycine-generating enzyme required for sulfatase activity